MLKLIFKANLIKHKYLLLIISILIILLIILQINVSFIILFIMLNDNFDNKVNLEFFLQYYSFNYLRILI